MTFSNAGDLSLKFPKRRMILLIITMKRLGNFKTGITLHWVSVWTNTNIIYDFLTSRDAGVENDMSLQLDTRNNKMPDNEPGVPNHAENGKVNDCLSHLNMNALLPSSLLSCLFLIKPRFCPNTFESMILSRSAIIQMPDKFRASIIPASTSVLLPCKK